MKPASDVDIIDMLFERNQEALKIIQDQFGKLIKRISLNILNNSESADECLNDVLLDVWNTIPPSKPSSISSYVCMLSRRRTIDKVRSDTASKRNRSVYITVSDELAEVEDGLDDILDSMSINAVINAFLKELTPINREIFISRYFDFESISSLSSRLHISQNSIKTRLVRMREKLRLRLTEGGIEL